MILAFLSENRWGSGARGATIRCASGDCLKIWDFATFLVTGVGIINGFIDVETFMEKITEH